MVDLNSITSKSIGELTDEDKKWLKENEDKLTSHQKELYKLFLGSEEGSPETDETQTPETTPEQGEETKAPGESEEVGEEGAV